MWQCSHCIFDSLNHHTCKDIVTLEHFLRLPLVVSLADLASTVPESVSCTSQDCRVVNKSVQDLISLLIFSDSLWLHLGYFRLSKKQVARLDLLGKTGREPEEAGTAVRPGCQSNPHGGEGKKEAWIAKVFDCSAVPRMFWQSWLKVLELKPPFRRALCVPGLYLHHYPSCAHSLSGSNPRPLCKWSDWLQSTAAKTLPRSFLFSAFGTLEIWRYIFLAAIEMRHFISLIFTTFD